MIRVDAILVSLAVISALGVVAAQHQSRKLFSELEREQSRTHELEIEWGQLQLEQSTWAALSRVEKLAQTNLGMRSPPLGHIVVVEGAQ